MNNKTEAPKWGMIIGGVLALSSFLTGIGTLFIFGLLLASVSYYLFYKAKKEKSKDPLGWVKGLRILHFALAIPFVFYIGTSTNGKLETPIVIYLIVGVLLFALQKFVKWYINRPQVDTPPNTDHGSAGWANDEQVRAATSHAGLFIGGNYYWDKSGHLLTVAGAGRGKGASLIIPTLLTSPYGSLFVIDPKGENAFITARYQSSLSGRKVHIIDPWGEQDRLAATHGVAPSGFNPFTFITKEMDELRDNCELIANYLIPENPNVKEPYWNERAKAMIRNLLMHIVTALPEEDHNFWTLYKMLRYDADNWAGLIFDMKHNDALDGLISIAAQEWEGIQKSDNTMGGIRSTAQNATTIFESPQLRKSLTKNDFDPYSLTDGNTTVYMVIPERFMETHSVWMRIVVGLCLKACNSRPKAPVIFLLDEFPMLGKMPDIQRGYAFARGQNITLWAFAQSLSQIREIYGENGMNTMLGNSSVFHVFGVTDRFTTTYVSDMLGVTTRITTSESFGTSGGNANSGTTYSTMKRPLLTPDEVATHQGIIAFITGLKATLRKYNYYDNSLAGFAEKADKRPGHQF